MEVGEYALGLLAIVSGLAVTDMVGSLHGLLRRFHRVRWDFLPVSAAAFVFLSILYGWFVSWRSPWETLPFWLLVLAFGQLVTLFLAAKAVLPDDDGSQDEVDLLNHYRQSNRYVWLSTATVTALLVIPFAPIAATRGRFVEYISGSIETFVWFALFLLLAMVQKMWLHRILVPLILVAALLRWSAQTITGTL